MEFIKLIISSSGRYIYKGASSIKMCILGCFLASNVYHPLSYIEFIFNEWEESTSSNITNLIKKNDNVLLTDLYSEEKIPTILKMKIYLTGRTQLELITLIFYSTTL